MIKEKKKKSVVNEELHDLFMDQLKDIYWAEKALVKAMPKMIKHSTADELIEALTMHLEVTKAQVTRLEEVFHSLDEKPQTEKCEAMEGLLKEAEEIMESTKKGAVGDAGVIAAGQKIEHYEIATYRTLCSFAKTLGEKEAGDLLQQTLEEEIEASESLSAISEPSANSKSKSNIGKSKHTMDHKENGNGDEQDEEERERGSDGKFKKSSEKGKHGNEEMEKVGNGKSKDTHSSNEKPNLKHK
jgi:ferritin-like metal-binding protein YciE